MFQRHARLLMGLFLLAGVAHAAEPSKGLKLAAPGLNAEGIQPSVAAFLSDHLSQQLAHRGLEVLTPTEVRALIGLERQRQMMGCGEQDGCLLELANALGADGVVTGAILKSAEGFAATVEIRGADGKVLGQAKRSVANEDGLLDALSEMAQELSAQAVAATGRATAAVGSDELVQNRVVRPKPRNVLSLSPLGVLGGFWAIEYERAFGSHLSAFVVPQLIVPYLFARAALEGTLGVRGYLFGDAPSGLGVGLYATVGQGRGIVLNQDQQQLTLDGPAFLVGAQVNYSAFVGEHFVISSGVTWGMNFLQGYLSRSPTEPLQAHLSLRVNLGWAF